MRFNVDWEAALPNLLAESYRDKKRFWIFSTRYRKYQALLKDGHGYINWRENKQRSFVHAFFTGSGLKIN